MRKESVGAGSNELRFGSEFWPLSIGPTVTFTRTSAYVVRPPSNFGHFSQHIDRAEWNGRDHRRSPTVQHNNRAAAVVRECGQQLLETRFVMAACTVTTDPK